MESPETISDLSNDQMKLANYWIRMHCNTDFLEIELENYYIDQAYKLSDDKAKEVLLDSQYENREYLEMEDGYYV